MRHISTLLETGSNGGATEKDIRDARGQFFTPESVACRLVAQSMGVAGSKRPLRLVDPFCGDGRLLVEAIRQIAAIAPSQPLHVELWELDPTTLETAIRHVQSSLVDVGLLGTVHSRLGNSFDIDVDNEQPFDLVLTNPPWEALKPDQRLLSRLSDDDRERYVSDLKHADASISAQFPESAPSRRFAGWGLNLSRAGLALSLRLARGGTLGVVMPASFLADSSTPQLRQLLARNFALHHVDYYPAEARLFSGMDVPFVTIVAEAHTAEREHSGGSSRGEFWLNRLTQAKWTGERIQQPDADQEDWFLPLTAASLPRTTMSKFGHLPTWSDTLGEHELWAGREMDETGYLGKLRVDGVPFLKGRDVQRYSFAEPDSQRIPREIAARFPSHEQRRIVWRDVSRPSQVRRVQAAVLPGGRLTGNSLGVLCGKAGTVNDDLLYWLLGVMNSATFEAQLRTVLATGHVTLTSLRKTRMPVFDAAERTAIGIATLAKAQLAYGSEDSVIQAQLEGVVAAAYGLEIADLESLIQSHGWVPREHWHLTMRAFEEAR